MAPVDGSTRKMSDVAQKSGGTVPGRTPLSPATLQTNRSMPDARPPAIGGGRVAITPAGMSLTLPAAIQSAKTWTSLGAGAVTWKSFHAGGDPVGMVGQ